MTECQHDYQKSYNAMRLDGGYEYAVRVTRCAKCGEHPSGGLETWLELLGWTKKGMTLGDCVACDTYGRKTPAVVILQGEPWCRPCAIDWLQGMVDHGEVGGADDGGT